MLTVEQLKQIAPRCNAAVIDEVVKELNARLPIDGIDSVTRIAAFLGQVLLESGEFRYTREVWDVNNVPAQLRYERNQLAAWPPTKMDPRNQLAFNLGNSEEGDGFVFRGWGPLQITGRRNTLLVSRDLFNDNRLVENTQLLDDVSIGIRGAIWYWNDRNINVLSDELNYVRVTKAVNGGTTHHERRLAYYYRALEVLGRETKFTQIGAL
jgi:putative chitinase